VRSKLQEMKGRKECCAQEVEVVQPALVCTSEFLPCAQQEAEAGRCIYMQWYAEYVKEYYINNGIWKQGMYRVKSCIYGVRRMVRVKRHGIRGGRQRKRWRGGAVVQVVVEIEAAAGGGGEEPAAAFQSRRGGGRPVRRQIECSAYEPAVVQRAEPRRRRPRKRTELWRYAGAAGAWCKPALRSRSIENVLQWFRVRIPSSMALLREGRRYTRKAERRAEHAAESAAVAARGAVTQTSMAATRAV